MPLGAQSALKVQQYPILDKISQSKISQFVQDRNGFIWLGTWDGLVRFDGRQTQTFKTYPGDSVRIENQRILNLHLTDSGNIWVQAYGGRCYYFDTSRNRYLNPLSGVGNTVRLICVVGNGVTWMEGSSGQLLRVQEVGPRIQVDTVTLPFDYSHLNHATLDSHGNEWLLTDRGACIWNRGQQIGTLPFDRLIENEDHILLSTQQQVYHYDPADGSCPSLGLQVTGGVRYLMPLSGGGLLVGGWGEVAMCRDLQKDDVWQFASIERYRFQAPVLRYAFEDSRHRIWLLGNGTPVYLVQDGRLRQLPYVGSPVRSTTTSNQLVIEDDYGTVWVQPGDNLPLAYYNPKNDCLEQAYTYQNGIRRPVGFYMRNGLIDQQHNFWGNIDEVGFCYLVFGPQEFEFLDKPEKNGARALMIDHRKRLWAGWRKATDEGTGGLSVYDAKRRLLGHVSANGHLVSDPRQSIPFNVYSLYEDSRHRIWVGTRYHGIYVLEPISEEATAFRVVHYEDLAPAANTRQGASVYDILEDRHGRIWLATFGDGLFYVDPSDERTSAAELRFHHVEATRGDYRQCRCLFQSADGLIWLGTTHGLLAFDGDSPALMSVNRPADHPYSLSSSNVMHITSRSDGSLLVSTFGGGINMLRPGYTVSDSLYFEHYDAHQGRYPDVVYAMLEDRDSCIWVMSEDGLVKFDPQLQHAGIFLRDTPCTEAHPVFDSEEQNLYLATSSDVLCFLKERHEPSHYQPPIAFTSAMIHHTDSSTLLPLTPVDTLLHFEADDRNFTLSFLTLDYSDPQKIQYAFRLAGKHSQWIPLANLPAVHIVDLPAGHYVLEVRSTNADGYWCNNSKRLQFTIQPYFYETLWFRLLAWTLVMALAGYLLYRLLKHFERRRIRAIESRFNQTKVRFFTDVAARRSPDDEAFLQKLMQYIEDHALVGDIGVEQVSAAVGMTYPAFYRKVKDMMDLTPVELMRQIRIQRAQHLLKTTDLSVSEIAFQCGYSTPQYFNRVFKEEMSMTPVEYRKRSKIVQN